jgi:hypothetical protein
MFARLTIRGSFSGPAGRSSKMSSMLQGRLRKGIALLFLGVKESHHTRCSAVCPPEVQIRHRAQSVELLQRGITPFQKQGNDSFSSPGLVFCPDLTRESNVGYCRKA